MPKDLYSFRGGIRLSDLEKPNSEQSRLLPLPASVSVPLSLTDGTALTALCKPGEAVLLGQPVAGAADGFTLCAPVSGTVVGISAEKRCIVLHPEGKQTRYPGCTPHTKKLSETGTEEIIGKIRAAGIRMKDGTDRPLSRVLEQMPDNVTRIVVNGTECEPELCARDTLLSEHPGDVVDGLKILMKALGVSRADIALEDRREETVNAVLSRVGKSDYLTVRIMDSKYPVSMDRILFKALTGNDIAADDRPENYGFTLISAETCAAVFRAFAYGYPETERYVYIGGEALRDPGVYRVPFGTAFADILSLCGTAAPFTLLRGGLLSGRMAEETELSGPDTAAVLCVRNDRIPRRKISACSRCGRCFDACPAKIYPGAFIDYLQKPGVFQMAKPSMLSCLDCGVCTYVCPSRIPVAARMQAALRNTAESGEEGTEV